jgi:hypothetical protein
LWRGGAGCKAIALVVVEAVRVTSFGSSGVLLLLLLLWRGRSSRATDRGNDCRAHALVYACGGGGDS